MNAAVERVIKLALELSEDERGELVSALVESLSPVDVPPAWMHEIERRMAKIESGDAVFHDAIAHATQLRGKFE